MINTFMVNQLENISWLLALSETIFSKLTLESGVDDSISLEGRHEDIEEPEKDKDPGSDSLYWFGSTLKEEETDF